MPLLVTESWLPGHPACRLVILIAELSRLQTITLEYLNITHIVYIPIVHILVLCTFQYYIFSTVSVSHLREIIIHTQVQAEADVHMGFMLLSNILKLFQRGCILSKINNHTLFQGTKQEIISLFMPHTYMCLPHCCYWLWEIKKYSVWMVRNSIMFIPSFMLTLSWFKRWYWNTQTTWRSHRATFPVLQRNTHTHNTTQHNLAWQNATQHNISRHVTTQHDTTQCNTTWYVI